MISQKKAWFSLARSRVTLAGTAREGLLRVTGSITRCYGDRSQVRSPEKCYPGLNQAPKNKVRPFSRGLMCWIVLLGLAQLTIADGITHSQRMSTGSPTGRGYPFVTASSGDHLASENGMFGLPEWITFSGYAEVVQRSTNFYQSNHDTILAQGDSRIEFWMPPGRKRFSWGPYIRVAGLDSNRSEAWENAWMAGPGFGFHTYPFSDKHLRKGAGWFGDVLGPLRLFGEYNRLDYVGTENEWRPDEQVRAGADYWRQRGINELKDILWNEVWAGLFWQSANEFDKNYDSTILGAATRLGARVPDTGLVSMFSPYLLLESSLTDNQAYYWENRLVGGVGIRFAPPLDWLPCEWQINRLVVFTECIDIIEYWRKDAPSGIPSHDFRMGIGFSIGDWYR